MKKFEHRISYYTLPYIHKETGVWIFKGKEPPTEPDIATLLSEEGFMRHIEPFEKEGFELMGTHPVMKAVVHQSQEQGPNPWGFAYNITSGLILMWKRACFLEKRISQSP